MEEEEFNWRCPYCDRDTTITKSNYSKDLLMFDPGVFEEGKSLGVQTSVIVCPNSECGNYTIEAKLYRVNNFPGSDYGNPQGDPLSQWALKPQSTSKQFPDYVPNPIIEDYKEACLIRDLSPKASATLSRRCLQGIIRDFFRVKGKNLFDEINKIKDQVDPLVWKAIDATRSIGNIGAHMGKDINIVIEVDSDEAGLLIGLIEILIREWYMARFEREKSLQSIVNVGEEKKGEKKKVNK